MNEPTQSAARPNEIIGHCAKCKRLMTPARNGVCDVCGPTTIVNLSEAARPSELLPCPFCGGEVHVCDVEGPRAGWTIICHRCDDDFWGHDPYSSREFMIEHWNTRVLPTPASVPPSEEAREWFRDMIRFAPQYSKLGRLGGEILTFLETAARPASIEGDPKYCESDKTFSEKLEFLEFCLPVFNGIRAVQSLLRNEGKAKEAGIKNPGNGEWCEGYAAAMSDAVKQIESFMEDYS